MALCWASWLELSRSLQGSAEGYVCEVLRLFYDRVNEELEFTGKLDYGV